MASQIVGIKQLQAPFERFVVDGFNFTKQLPEIKHWFLTHAHSDHTCGLRGDFDQGTIYCTTITKALICRDIGNRLERRIRVIDVGDSAKLNFYPPRLNFLL